MPEWEFTEEPEKVDCERIARELSGVPAIAVYSYLGALRREAPRTWEHLKAYSERTGWLRTSVNWG